MGARKSQRKGRGFEHEAARILGHGCEVLGIYQPHDLEMPVNGESWLIECKRRANGMGFAYDALEANDAVVFRADHKPALVILRADRFAQLVGAA